jgi:hypothetical protein
MATKWMSRRGRGRDQGDGARVGRRVGEGNRFEVLGRLTSEVESEPGTSGGSREDGNRQEATSETLGSGGENVEMSEEGTARDEREIRGDGTRKRTLETRSPGTHLDARVSRLGLDEFDLGEVFEEVNKYWEQGARELIEKVPEGYRQELKSGMEIFLEGMKKVMDGVSDKVTMERRKREAGEMNVEDKLGKLEDKIKDIQRKSDNVMTDNIQDKVKSSAKEMECKLKGAMKTLKLTDVDFGEITQDRTKMVRTVTNRLRNDIHP